MDNAFAHLSSEAAQWMNESQSARLDYVREDYWIPYPRANQIIRTFDDLMNAPQVQRSDSYLLLADSDNGKSSLLKRYRTLHAPTVGDDGILNSPFVLMETPSRPHEGRFWSELLSALCIGHRPNDSVPVLQEQALEVLRLIKCKVLAIDEVHNMLMGSAKDLRLMLVVLKTLSNKLKIPIICAGIRDAVRALHTDKQLSSRYEPLPLPHWQLNHDYLRLLTSMERRMPLANPSNLASRELAPEIHRMSDNTIGGTAKVLKKAAVQAIETGREVIDLKTLKSIGWTRLADYDKHATG